jgi:hypothetical protein
MHAIHMSIFSDGGHFDNLGLYEMVVRRCRYIVISDAGQDQEFVYEDLKTAVQRARDDLGVPIQIERIGNASAVFALGRVKYSQADGPNMPDGVLIYLKPHYFADVPEQITAYASENPTFPQHSTRNQWYDVHRFESYRGLGVYTIDLLTQGILPNSRTLSGWVEHLRRVSTERQVTL